MDLEDIQYFVHVAEVGSITAAARDLGIVQPALTRHIRQIEQSVGTPLLLRLPRGVELTAAGWLFIEHCRRILREVALARAEVAMLGNEFHGIVNVGILGSFATSFITHLIKKVREAHQVTFRTGGTAKPFCEELLAGKLDVAVIDNPSLLISSNAVRSHLVQIVPLAKESFVVISPPELRGDSGRRSYTIDELAKTPIIVTRGVRVLVDEQIYLHGKILNVECETNSVDIIHKMLLENIGLALLPVSVFRDDIIAGRFSAFPILNADLHRKLFLAHRTNRVPNSVGSVVSPEASLPFLEDANRANSVLEVAQIIQSEFVTLASQGSFTTIPNCTQKSRRAPRSPIGRKQQ